MQHFGKCLSFRSQKITVVMTNVQIILVCFIAAITPDRVLADRFGASVAPTLEELTTRHEEFDSFGWPPKGRFGNDSPTLKRYTDFNRKQWVENGLAWLVAPTLMFQQGTHGGPNDSTANFQNLAILAWQPVRDTAWGTGTFVFSHLRVFQLTSTTGVDMTNALGLSYPISDSVADAEIVKALYWQQDFPDGGVDLKFGQIELNGLVNQCSYMCDDTQGFIVAPLSTNIAATMPGPGWGVQAGVSLGSNARLEFGVSDANGDGTLNFDRDLKADELAYAAILSASDPFPSLGPGAIRLATYYVDATSGTTPKASSRGVVLNAEQEIGELAYSIRYTKADGRLGAARHGGAASVVWKNAFGNSTDWLGLGVGYMQPTAVGSKPEYATEVYYRTQLTPLMQLTVGASLVEANKNSAAAGGHEAIFNFRLRMAF